MRNAVSYALAVALFSCGASGFAYAQALSDQNVRVVYVSRADLNKSSGTILPTITRGVQDQAQQELNANPDLMSHLQSKNVELKNVVKIDKAANGSLIVYVK